ncbi:GNAT family N-acetyltransferase [Stenotrophomonas sp. ISL-67]|uniref:GNAT family N-acetyltransferase n=1 Tax=Stenotrophomonas sp. ISL-67 TaxID=2819171 RepID=UPI001BE9EA11|nr:GNAT family N-acetyltransferase [Stenotrophomonas sp. ISL-67]MBT2767781.1 GNAT family N-acetyltransferase [Stenotrophomonas sp. ISL-67]
MRLSAPVPLHAEHVIDGFRCSAPALGKWLHERAHRNQASGASRCFVTCDEQQRVAGYYALSAGAIAHEAVPGRIRRNMPDPIPVIVLGRLAVHVDWAGQGIGQGLLKDAVLRALQACTQLGARALLCHAIDEPAKAFYLKHGFMSSPIHPLTVMLPLSRDNAS